MNTALPEKVFLKRKPVLQAVGGRAELEKLENEGMLTRLYLTGYKCAHYRRAQVMRVVKIIHGGT